MNPVNNQRFKIGDKVKLNRQIKGKDKSFNYPEGTIGVVAQIYHASAIRVNFGNKTPIVASIYLSKAD
ncbi:MAG: hypothetical protein ACRCZS_02455 [Chroococcidiopsis sp.]